MKINMPTPSRECSPTAPIDVRKIATQTAFDEALVLYQEKGIRRYTRKQGVLKVVVTIHPRKTPQAPLSTYLSRCREMARPYMDALQDLTGLVVKYRVQLGLPQLGGGYEMEFDDDE